MNRSHLHQTFAYGAVSGLLVIRPDDVGILSLYGPVTSDVFERLRCRVLTRTAKPLRAVCLRLDRAVVVFGEKCLAALAVETYLSVSAAIVVAPDLQKMFQPYAWRMAECGYTRAVFTSPAEALLWSVAQSRLAKAQSAWQAQRAACALLKAA